MLGIVEAGELFGELALLDGKERSADAVAFEDCVVASLDRRDLLAVLRESPETAIRLLEFVCGRVRAANDRFEGVVFLSVEARLARLLLTLRRDTRAARGSSAAQPVAVGPRAADWRQPADGQSATGPLGSRGYGDENGRHPDRSRSRPLGRSGRSPI